ncbi:DMT family transporter [Formicincola oecophyllae]|uniref:DMT family transporter n=2 Tax=Formicincola oecophyllae TaxID=2558361 RepID=A0A4Y6UD43_9PROT|nr:DMT family transporter [Formicincola oecophyllae]
MLGILYGLGATALWGGVFVVPEMVRPCGPLEITVGRYLAYGLLSLALVAPRLRSLARKLTWADWRGAAWLAFTGNTFYYFLLSKAVLNGGVAITSLITGFSPVVVTLIGARDKGAVPLRKLWPSLLFCAAGAVCIGWQAVARATGLGGAAAQASGSTVASETTMAVGVLCAVGSLVLWSAFTIGNSRWLKRVTVSEHDWNLLIGLCAGAQTLLLVPFMLPAVHSYSWPVWERLVVASLGVGVLASIVGNTLWGRMSRLLPLTLVGQMVVCETMFALLYGFLWARRWPSVAEWCALLCVTISVGLCVAAHRPPRRRRGR